MGKITYIDTAQNKKSIADAAGSPNAKPSKADFHAAVETMLRYVGEDSAREGLVETPARVERAFHEYFAGYLQDPEAVLSKTFDEVGGFAGPIRVDGIQFVSHCEHHMAPFHGVVDITYIPDKRVVGLSKLARLVDIYAKRLQVQERLNIQIAEAIFQHLQPKVVAVEVAASHFCLNHRGATKPGSMMKTRQILGDKELLTF